MDFDKRINRYHTNSLKYDFKKQRNKPEDVFPMWIADMDFKCPTEVLEDMQKKLEHGIFGYSKIDEPYFNAVSNWYRKHFQTELQMDWIINTPGVVFSLAMAVKAFTKEGDCILINNPVYYPFSEVIEDNNRTIISSDLINHKGHYEIDFNDFENKIRQHHIKLYLFCSPHNPVGRVWSKEELDNIIRICKKYNVMIVSDEIHSDFVWKGQHTCLLHYLKEYDQIIICTSPSKTFNLAGLQVSNIFIPNETIRNVYQHEIDKTGYSLINIMGLVACQAAYTKGENWYEKIKQYLKSNIEYTQNYIAENLPKLKIIQPEGTYLLWLDFNEFQLSDEEIDSILIHEAKLWLNNGTKFGESGKGFQRLNIALPKEDLKYALEQLKNAFVNR